jgi:hypothetical protein
MGHEINLIQRFNIKIAFVPAINIMLNSRSGMLYNP